MANNIDINELALTIIDQAHVIRRMRQDIDRLVAELAAASKPVPALDRDEVPLPTEQ